MNKPILPALLFGAALAALLFVNPMTFQYDPTHFTVLKVHVWAIGFALLGLWFAFVVCGYPAQRGQLAILTVLALALVALVRLATWNPIWI
jgi:hypothetical protein